MSSTPPLPPFLFACCQVGAEGALKEEMERLVPGLRLAFSRPGFVTFKLPEPLDPRDDFDPRSIFARALGFSLGRAGGTSGRQLAGEAWRLAKGWAFDHLHVWPRDAAPVGERGFSPQITPLAEEAGRLLLEEAGGATPPVNARARSGQLVLDCVLVEADEWWIGLHRAAAQATRFPGGLIPVEEPLEIVSRAYLKTAEALAWSRIPLRPGDRCVELGSAPGGACQALLERGVSVMGVDPAQMDERIVAHPNFTHIKKRAADLKRREYAEAAWLLADINVPPGYTLDAVEGIVTHRQVNIRGLLLTLKLPQWKLAGELPSHLARIRSWGFRHIQARQLAHNRQEVCVYAVQRKALTRLGKPRRPKRKAAGR